MLGSDETGKSVTDKANFVIKIVSILLANLLPKYIIL